jgi:hypothetical protein
MGGSCRGEITRLNRKIATICCNPSGHWRVSPTQLRPIADAFRSPTERVVSMSANRKPG